MRNTDWNRDGHSFAYLTARTSVLSSAQIPSITNTSSDVSLLLQGVAALCLEMSLQVQCGVLSKDAQVLSNTPDLSTWDYLTQNTNWSYPRDFVAV